MHYPFGGVDNETCERDLFIRPSQIFLHKKGKIRKNFHYCQITLITSSISLLTIDVLRAHQQQMTNPPPTVTGAM